VSIIDSDLAEHIVRARFFLEQSRFQSDAEKRSRFIMASVYPARAVVEVVIDHLKRGMIKGDFREFLSEAAETVRYFKAIEYLRDHDFHRRAVQFVPGRQAMFGPIRLSTGNSPRGRCSLQRYRSRRTNGRIDNEKWLRSTGSTTSNQRF